MIEIVRTNDLVCSASYNPSWRTPTIPVFVADAHISALEGMIGAFPRRLLVPADHVAQARRLDRRGGACSAELRHA